MDIQNNLGSEFRTIICNETAIKPYAYLRNDLLHVRYTVDRCIELTPTEVAKLKVDMTCGDKQEVLLKAWDLQEKFVKKPVIMDGIVEVDKRIKESKENGQQN